jgi:hypothetical protein
MYFVPFFFIFKITDSKLPKFGNYANFFWGDGFFKMTDNGKRIGEVADKLDGKFNLARLRADVFPQS